MLESLRQMYEEALEAGRRRDYAEAVRLLQELLIQTDQIPEALLYLGRGYHALRDFHRAAQVLRLYLNTTPDSAQGHFFAGRAYFAIGLMPAAVHHLRRSVELDAAFPPALGLLGLAALKSGRSKTAIGFFEQALKLDPENPRLFTGYLNALLTQAIHLYYRSQYPEARELLEFLLKHRPASPVIHVYLAGILRELGELDLALRHWGEASRLCPQDPTLLLQKAVIHLQRGDSRRALEELEAASPLLGGITTSVSDMQELARLTMMVLFQNHRYRAALEYARRILRISYADAQTHAVMAECFVHLGELGKARNHYLRSIELEPKQLEYRYGLASVLWAKGDYAELTELAERILKSQPEDKYASYYRALCLPFLGLDVKSTIPALQQEIHQHGPDPNLMSALAQEYLRADLPQLAAGWLKRTLDAVADHEPALRACIETESRLERPERCLQAYAEYLRHYPRNSGLRRDYARLLFRSKKFSRAAAEIERVLPEEPRNPVLRRMLATSYLKVRRYGEAVLLFRDLLREEPSSEELLAGLVRCLESSGSRPTAIALVKKASQAFPHQPGYYELLGGLYLRSGELERAAEALRQAVGLFPHDEKVHRALGSLYHKMGNVQFAERFLARAEALKKAQRQPKKKAGVRRPDSLK
jgi:tetratricopeptide (TPR) repeat protein